MADDKENEKKTGSSNPIEDLEDGAGCVEIWEELSRQRKDD